MDESVFCIEPIAKDHTRNQFQCGNPFLNAYLHRYARQNSERGLSKAYVMTVMDDRNVIGYYTLSASHILFENAPPDLVRSLPRYPVPTARIGELAVDTRYQGKGIGAILLLDALHRICTTAESIGILAIVVDAIDESAVRFYQHFGFEDFAPGSRRLYLTLKDALAWAATAPQTLPTPPHATIPP